MIVDLAFINRVFFYFVFPQKYDDDDDEDIVAIEDEEEGFDSNSSKVMNLKVTSLRTDMVLKSAFQIARKYETRD